MRFNSSLKISARIGALLIAGFLLSIPAVHATAAGGVFSISRTDSSIATWFYFVDAAGHITTSGYSGSPTFSYQLNSYDSATDTDSGYQMLLYGVPGPYLQFDDAIGCAYGGTCEYYPSAGTDFGGSIINSTSPVYVFAEAINAGSTTEGYTITSCNVSFNVPEYSFYGVVINMSTCSIISADTWYDPVSQGDWYSSSITYLQSVPVGYAGDATFHHTEIKGELFQYEDYNDDYSSSAQTITNEGTNVNLDFGTIGDVIPLCYYSPDASNPC